MHSLFADKSRRPAVRQLHRLHGEHSRRFTRGTRPGRPIASRLRRRWRHSQPPIPVRTRPTRQPRIPALAILRSTPLIAAAAITAMIGGCAGLNGERSAGGQSNPGMAASPTPAWLTVRGQSPSYPGTYPSDTLPGGYYRAPQPVSGGAPPTANAYAPPATYGGAPPQPRSEEHTSELQSLRHLVCRLLLEK